MSLIQKLYETYDNCKQSVGDPMDKNVPLVPVSHTTANAQVEIAIDKDGHFRRARTVEKDEAVTIIPCTESSGGRTKKAAPHPLSDKLQYAAKDYPKYSANGKKSYFNSYEKQLKEWCGSEYEHPKVRSVLEYITGGNMIKDLVENGILFADNNGKLIKKPAGKALEIFKVVENQEDVFVRWVVEVDGDPDSKLWQDKTVWESWIGYYAAKKNKEKKNLCYVTGEYMSIPEMHPSKIRNAGDKAKIISSNDDNGFTFRGKFIEDSDVFGIGYDVTQKAHAALRWLIGRQGYHNGDQVILAWNAMGKNIPQPFDDDPFSSIIGEEIESDSQGESNTSQEVGIKLAHKIAGYRAELGDTSMVMVVGLDSATKGRMSITYYRELMGSDFLNRLENWHNTCSWRHFYKKKKFEGAPAPRDIAEAAYGRRVDDKLRKATVERILPCIVDGRPIPKDIVVSVIRRAVKPESMDEDEWKQTVSIACSLYRSYSINKNNLNEKEEYRMALEEERNTRDYLYGRLLALADNIERRALDKSGQSRQTSAMRLMQRFADRPFTTWRTIELSIAPYREKLREEEQSSRKRDPWDDWQINKVKNMFMADDFTDNSKLTGEFLLGFSCQKEFRSPKKDETKNQTNNQED